MFDRLLGDRPFGWRLPGPLAERWTAHRLALVAAIEHLTAALGSWLLDAEGFDRLDPPPDPVMLDLLRWHAAEEVEHRAVAFDLSEELAGGYLARLVATAQVVPVLIGLWLAGIDYLMRHDPARPARATWAGYRRAVRAGVLPSARKLAGMVPPYLRPGHHPSADGSTGAAVAYLARFEAVPAVP
jgi:predicted metal-dependent hydrolase